jgi:alcohol dehydrogenase, propanol-preferring
VRAVRMTAPGAPLQLEELPDPVPGTGETVIDVLACGICHSDLHAVAGDYPTVLPVTLGHEVVGTHPTLGNVLVYAPWGCRLADCYACASGQENICPNSTEAGLFRDGGYAEKMLVIDERYLVPIGDLDPASAAPLACGGLTAYRAVKHALPFLTEPSWSSMSNPSGAPKALVIGAGGLGQLGLQYLLALTDAEVTVLDASAAKREQALALGAHAAVAPGEVEGIFGAVIDFVGAQATLESAAAHVSRQGIVVLVGLYGGSVPFGLGKVPHEARLMTSIWGSLAELHELVALVQQHDIASDVEVVGLSDVTQAHERLQRGDVRGRLVIDPRA